MTSTPSEWAPRVFPNSEPPPESRLKDKTRLLRLAESIKTKSKPNQNRSTGIILRTKRKLDFTKEPSYTNIEHLVHEKKNSNTTTPTIYNASNQPTISRSGTRSISNKNSPSDKSNKKVSPNHRKHSKSQEKSPIKSPLIKDHEDQIKMPLKESWASSSRQPPSSLLQVRFTNKTPSPPPHELSYSEICHVEYAPNKSRLYLTQVSPPTTAEDINVYFNTSPTYVNGYISPNRNSNIGSSATSNNSKFTVKSPPKKPIDKNGTKLIIPTKLATTVIKSNDKISATHKSKPRVALRNSNENCKTIPQRKDILPSQSKQVTPERPVTQLESKSPSDQYYHKAMLPVGLPPLPDNCKNRSQSLTTECLSLSPGKKVLTTPHLFFNKKRSSLFFQQRSNSLPKSFLSEKNTSKTKISLTSPWRRNEITAGQSTSSIYRQNSTRDLVDDNKVYFNSDSKRVNRSSSQFAALRERPTSRSEWDIRRPWLRSKSDGISEKLVSAQSVCRLPSTDSTASRIDNSGEYTPGEDGLFQKFRKTFSLRFSKNKNQGTPLVTSNGIPKEQVTLTLTEPSPPKDVPNTEDVAITNGKMNDSLFRFGPLVWRASKDRKKGKKAARNAKCNSADSGIQIESLASSDINGYPDDNIDDDETVFQPLNEEPEIPLAPIITKRLIGRKGKRPMSEVVSPTRLQNNSTIQHTWNPLPPTLRRSQSEVGVSWGVSNNKQPQLPHSSTSISIAKTDAPVIIFKHIALPTDSTVISRCPRHLQRSASQPVIINCHSVQESNNCCEPSSIEVSDDDLGVASSLGSSEEDLESEKLRKISLQQTESKVIYAEALWDHVTLDPEELPFRVGDVIQILSRQDDDWWWGQLKGKNGWFPASFIRLRVSQEETQEEAKERNPARTYLKRKQSVSLVSNEQVRSNIIREIVSTERDFVKNLRDVVQGFYRQTRKRTDMFTDLQVSTIFGNIEQVYFFQQAFLAALEERVDWTRPHEACIGECFLKFRPQFEIYSEYCNNHPSAVDMLQSLYEDERYRQFFEACRLLQGMIEISLDGFLLTPVQKICKYPLQLAELLKYTKASHPDYEAVTDALTSVREVAMLINERKRRVECLEKLAAWQMEVEGWEEEDLLCRSSQLVHQGEVSKMTSGKWAKDVTLFLFDHQLIFCKKDILKREKYFYKGRINIDTSVINNIPDGRDVTMGVNVKHGWRVYSQERRKWVLFQCRTSCDKIRWMEVLREERDLVERDRHEGICFGRVHRERAAALATNNRGRRERDTKAQQAFKVQKRIRAVSPAPSKHLSVLDPNLPMKRGGSWIPFGARRAASRASIDHIGRSPPA